MTVPTEPTDLLGAWRLERVIEDRLAGERLTVTGTTELTREAADRVRWREEGTLVRRTGSFPVFRTLYVVRRTPGQWWVLFEDGRDFHPWTPDAEVDHPCGADRYRGRIDTAGLPAGWSVTWEVSGPAKDYSMLSELSR